MGSKWCPCCGKIISTNGIPNFCTQGCGSLADEPLLPPHTEWKGGYYGMIEFARKEYEKRQKEKQPEAIEIGPGRLQMRLF